MTRVFLDDVLNAYDIAVMRRTMSMQDIAEHYGVKINSLYCWCKRNLVLVTRITNDEVLEQIANGKCVKEIANDYQVSSWTVYNRLKDLGIKNGGRNYECRR